MKSFLLARLLPVLGLMVAFDEVVLARPGSSGIVPAWAFACRCCPPWPNGTWPGPAPLAGTLAVYVAIVLAIKLAGDVAWAYRLSRQILDFVMSPLPVAGLYVLLWTSFGAHGSVSKAA